MSIVKRDEVMRTILREIAEAGEEPSMYAITLLLEAIARREARSGHWMEWLEQRELSTTGDVMRWMGRRHVLEDILG